MTDKWMSGDDGLYTAYRVAGDELKGPDTVSCYGGIFISRDADHVKAYFDFHGGLGNKLYKLTLDVKKPFVWNRDFSHIELMFTPYYFAMYGSLGYGDWSDTGNTSAGDVLEKYHEAMSKASLFSLPPMVRTWLVSEGYDAVFMHCQSMEERSDAYNYRPSYEGIILNEDIIVDKEVIMTYDEYDEGQTSPYTTVMLKYAEAAGEEFDFAANEYMA